VNQPPTAAELRRNPELFARTVLPDFCRHPFASIHRRMFDWHVRAGQPVATRHGWRLAVAAPRGSAKSTIVSLFLVAHDLVFDREPYIVLISATERQARQRLRTLREVLVREELLRYAANPSAVTRMTRHTLEFASSRVDAFGAGCELRGISHGAYRPTKIILDDAESSRAVRSAAARLQLEDWFAQVAEYLGDRYTHLLAIGTILHRRSLLSKLLQRPDFVPLFGRSIMQFADDSSKSLWQKWESILLHSEEGDRRGAARDFFLQHRVAMEQGSRVLWPQKEDYEELMAQLTLQGRRAFYQEKQNEPIDSDGALFQPERILRTTTSATGFTIYRSDAPLAPVRQISANSTTLPRFGFLDTALGKKASSQSGDFAALATVVRLPDGLLLLEDLWVERAAPTVQIDAILRRHAHHSYAALGIEAVGFQGMLAEPLRATARERNLPPPRVIPIIPKVAKLTRIAALEPLFATGQLILGSNLPAELFEELEQYPQSAHDDALDALAGAVELARSHAAVTGGTSLEAIGQRGRGSQASPPWG
jgi:predicted phage terminase large subunit-like protein